MPAKVSQTLRVLLEMRDEMRGMRGELRELNARTANVESRIDNLERTTATEMSATREAIQQVVVLLRDRRDRQGEQLADHEKRIAALEKRTRLRAT